MKYQIIFANYHKRQNKHFKKIWEGKNMEV